LSSPGFRQAKVPIFQNFPKLPAKISKLCHGLLYTFEFFCGQGSHLPAGKFAAVSGRENPRQFGEGKPDCKRTPHCANSIDVLWRIHPVAIRSAHRGRQDSDSLVMAQQIRADASELCELAGAKQFFVAQERLLKREKYEPWNPFQGQALSFRRLENAYEGG